MILIFVILVATSNVVSISYSSIESEWTIGKNMPSERLEVGGVALNNKIYIIGGMDDKGTTNLTEVYDIDSDKWITASPIPGKRDHAGAATYDGKIYVVGGFNERGISTRTLFIYDPSTDKWERGMDMPTARGALAAKFVKGILYVIGGDATQLYDSQGFYNPQGVVTTNEAYDPKVDSWVIKAPMPTARDHLSSAVVDNKIFVIGGRQPEDGPIFNDLDANEMYDPESNSWISLEPLPTKRSGLAAASVDDKIYVIGGESTKRTFDTNEKYNTKTHSWDRESPVPSARHGLSATSIDGKIYVIAGGTKPGGSGSNENEIFQVR